MSSASGMVVLGSGAWGCALAIHLSRQNLPVRLWGNEAQQMATLIAKRENPYFLPGVAFPPSLQACMSLEEALQGVFTDVLIAVPSHAFQDVLTRIKPYLGVQVKNVVWATKGLVPETGEFLHEAARKAVGENIPLAVLSGPSFAKEVAVGMPTAVTLACDDPAFTQALIQRFHTPTFQLYTTTDYVGVALGGVVKNVLAVAVGLADGMGYGANTKAAFVTRGIAELRRLGKSLGAQPETLVGLSGLGDVVLTCTDDQSRNRRFGFALGQGKSPQVAQALIGHVVEGAHNAHLVYQLAKRQGIEMPICEQVYKLLNGFCTLQEAMETLLRQPSQVEST